MKRRRFMQTLTAASALAPLATEPAPAQPAAASSPNASAQPRSGAEAARLEMSVADVAADYTPRFFTTEQFAALKKLSGILQPALNGLPGAIEAGAPEFLDFLISRSPAQRQTVYRTGLDILNAQARKKFGKSLAELESAQAESLLSPLRQPWTYNPPADPLAYFLREAKRDVRQATVNSHEYVAAQTARGQSGGGASQYWYPLD